MILRVLWAFLGAVARDAEDAVDRTGYEVGREAGLPARPTADLEGLFRRQLARLRELEAWRGGDWV